MSIILDAAIELPNGNRGHKYIQLDEYIESPEGVICHRKFFGAKYSKKWNQFVIFSGLTLEEFKAYDEKEVVIRYCENPPSTLPDIEDVDTLVLLPYTEDPYKFKSQDPAPVGAVEV